MLDARATDDCAPDAFTPHLQAADARAALAARVGALYDAAFDPARWPSAVAGVIDALGSATRGCVFIERRPADYLWILPAGVSPQAVAAYAAHYADLDPLLPALRDAPAGAVLDLDAVQPRAALEASAYYAGYARPHDVHACLAGVAWRTADFVVKLYCVRGRDAPPFRAADRAAVASLLPHLQRALRTARRLARLDAERGAILGALDVLADAVVLTDADGRIIDANRAAAALLGAGDVLAVERLADGGAGRIRAARPADTAALRHLIATVAGAPGDWASPGRSGGCADLTAGTAGGTLRLARPGRGPLSVAVTPVRRRPAVPGPFARETGDGARCRPAAVLFVTDPEARPAGAVVERLRATYGLTPAEADVAVAVSRGAGLRAIATDRGVGLATVRSQLLHVYAKTGIQNQAGLSGLVVRFGGVL